MNTPRLSRRHVLRAGTALLGLPLLEAMLPRGPRGAAYASELTEPTRLLYYYVPNGMHMPAWTPTDTGPAFTLSPTLAPLAAHRDQTLVLTGLANRNAIESLPGDHARGTGAFLTAQLPVRTEGSGIRNGISVDQVAAAELGLATRFSSLQLGMEGGISVGNCDSGYSCAYVRNISWADAETPLPKMTNPLVVFHRLFGTPAGALTLEQIERQQARRTSILDYARQDADALRVRLGATDRQKLDQYLTGIRAVERQILEAGDLTCGPDSPPDAFDQDVQLWSSVMNQLMVQALACDQTRVLSFMFGNGGSNRSFPFLGVTGAHHEISHHQGNVENHARLMAINRFEVACLADLLDGLRAQTMPDGSTLLDNTLVYFSSEIEDGDAHRHTNLPVLVCGGAGRHLATGQHIRLTTERPMANLFVSMLHAAGVGVDRFGNDGDGPLEETRV